MKKFLLITFLIFGISCSWSQTNAKDNKKEEPEATTPKKVTKEVFEADKATMKVIKSEVEDYDYTITYIDRENNIKSYSTPLTYNDLKVPEIVDKNTFESDKKDAKIVSHEVEDNFYVTTYLDSNGNLKKHQIRLTKDSPYLFAVDKSVYDNDRAQTPFKLQKEEIEDNYLVVTYFDSSGILKKYQTPIINSFNNLPIVPLTVDKDTYDKDVKEKEFAIVKDEVEDYYHVITYFDKNQILKKYKTAITSVSPYKITAPKYVEKTEYDIDGKSKGFKEVSSEIKDNYMIITYFSGETLKIYQTPITSKGYIETYNWGLNLSAMTVPFKVRPKTGNTPSESKADVDNLGLYLSYNYSIERWYFDDSTNELKFGVGFFAAPMVETLTSTNVDNPENLTKESNQCYLSMALALTIGYNKITLAIIPLGADTGFSPTSRKWRYDGNYWWGFGIGIDTSLFGF